ncbi:hypothetical protein M8C21_032838, partial [Ambrosia artemisiifolia]
MRRFLLSLHFIDHEHLCTLLGDNNLLIGNIRELTTLDLLHLADKSLQILMLQSLRTFFFFNRSTGVVDEEAINRIGMKTGMRDIERKKGRRFEVVEITDSNMKGFKEASAAMCGA